jgi:magnesium-transporting ATPase (P-type)
METIILESSVKYLFGLDSFNSAEFWPTVLRFFYNFGIIFFIARVVYYRVSSRADYFFTYLLVSTIVFVICNLLDAATFQIGFALGLFAVFGIIRYRTAPIPIREMTYLFVIIGISVKNALITGDVSLFRVLFADSIIILITWGAQSFLLRNKLIRKTITYDKMELLKPDKYEELLQDISTMSGFPIEKAQVGRVDYIKRQARLRIFFYEKDAPHNYSDDDQ